MSRHRVGRGSKLLGGLVVVAAAGTVGQVLSKRMTSADEDSDVFTIAAIFAGQDFESRSTALRSGSALVVMGGVEMDLRDANLDPAGARLDLTTVMGGVELRLPRGWLVDVQAGKALGGVDTRLTESSELPDDAPTLHVTTNTWFGGVAIRQDR